MLNEQYSSNYLLTYCSNYEVLDMPASLKASQLGQLLMGDEYKHSPLINLVDNQPVHPDKTLGQLGAEG